jgi:hypothetical protein
MEKELKIVAPNGYEIDKENSTLEKIVFKKIDDKPKSWEEYCKQQITNGKKGYYIRDTFCDVSEIAWDDCVTTDAWKDVLPSKESAEAFIAMMQLVSLRQAWVGDWKPDWTDFSDKWCIVNSRNKLIISNYIHIVTVLSFPTEKMVNEFMACFWGLLEIAKPLI